MLPEKPNHIEQLKESFLRLHTLILIPHCGTTSLSQFI